MALAIRGSVFGTGATGSPLTYATVKVALDIGGEPEWTAYTNGSGQFKIELTPEDIERIFSGRRHREFVFKVYALSSSSSTTGSGGIFLGCQTSFISRSTLRGTNSVTLSASPSYSLTAGYPNYAVSGYVVDADGTPRSGVVVVVYKKELRSEDSLGTATTDSDGRFLVRYVGTEGGHDDGPEFSIRVATDDLSVSATTDHLCNPPPDLTVRLVQENAEYRGPSDFDLDVAVVSPLLDTAALDELDLDDVNFLLCRTQHESRALTTLVRAHALQARYSLSAEAFTAFAHVGIALSTNSILALNGDQVAQAVAQAVADNAVPSSLSTEVASIVSTLAAARIDRVVPAADPASTPLGAILVAAGLSVGKPRLFAEAFAAHTGTPEAFWTDLRASADFGDVLVNKIQFSLQVGSICGGHAPLVKRLDQKRTDGDLTAIAELAQYNESDWIGFMEDIVDGSAVNTPLGFVGADDTAKRANYAAAITLMVADLFPSAHLAYRLPDGSVTSDIVDFIVQNPSFSFDRTVINEFLPTASGLPPAPEDQETLRLDLLKVQRVFAMSPRYGRTAIATALLNEGVASAAQIRSMGYAAFKSKFSLLMDATSLATTYEKAEQVATTAINSWLFMRPEMHFPPLAVMPQPSSADSAIQAKLDSHDYCACPPCESVLGPAAYFLDIMQFVYRREPFGPAVMTWMGTHRPELQFVDLSCENSDVTVPTIDLINEVLESRADGPLGVPGAPNDDRQTTWTADDLLVYPEHIRLGVYEKLADPAHACFPLNLPFDLSSEEAHAYLELMGTSRLEIQDQLEWFSGLGQSEPYRVNERLGLSSGQASIIRELDGTPPLEVLWGFDEEEAYWAVQLNTVEMFLDRSGLDFDGLKELLRTKDLIGYTELVYETPCSLVGAKLAYAENHAVLGLDSNRLRMLQAFFRLRRSLGWTTPELDATSRAMEISFISAGMDRLSRFLRIRNSFKRLPLGELLSWFAPLDQHTYVEGTRSYYDEVVHPLTVSQPFVDLDGSTDLVDVKDDLLGVLRTDYASLEAAFTATGLTEASPLNLTNLSALYRVTSIARALKSPVTDLVALTKYKGSLDAAPGAFAGNPTAPLGELLTIARDVKAAGFTVSELDWVLRGLNEETFGGDSLSVMRVLTGLIVALQQADKDLAQNLLPNQSTSLIQIERLLTGPLETNQLMEVLQFIRKETSPLPVDFPGYRASLLPFLADGSPASVELDKAFVDADTSEARASKLLPELGAWLRRQALERLVVQQLAAAFSLDIAATDVLLRKFSVVGPGKALDQFTADAFFATSSFDPDAEALSVQEASFPRLFLERTGVSPVVEMYRALRRVALLVAKFRLGPGLLQWLLNTTDVDVQLPGLVNIVDQNAVDAYAGWDWLRRAVRFRDELLSGSDSLAEVLQSFFVPPESFVKDTVLGALAVATGWDSTTLTDFEAAQTVAQVDLKRLDAVEAFAAAFRLSTKLGVHPNTLRSWAKLPVTSTTAAAIRGAARAKLGGAGWTPIAHPIRDRLRVKQRDVLADYLVYKEGLKTREDLFGLLLLDVEMGPCNRTTRLLFATAAVQLFVQRALMGLVVTEFFGLEGKIVLSDEDAAEWEWMKRYRVWEANRKIFLYPENWVLPELRDDKTPLFRRLEEELGQNEVDAVSVEKTLIHYLEGLREIAHLQPSGMYHEIEGEGASRIERMHVFAHSHADPGKMFYRHRENEAQWTPWEELPFQVDHKGVLPLVVDRRLMLIWPKVEIRTARPSSFDNGTDSPTPSEYPEVSLVWAEKMHDAWSGVFFSEDRVPMTAYKGSSDASHVNRDDIHITSSISTGGISIRVNSPTVNGAMETADFGYHPCRGTLTLYRHGDIDYMNHNVHGWTLDKLTWRDQGVALTPSAAEYSYTISLTYEVNKGSYPIVVTQKTPSYLLFPRQEYDHNVTRPFLFSDNDVALYMDPAGQFNVADATADSQSVQSLGQQSLLPYIGLAGITTEYMSSPADSALLQDLSGGDNVAMEQHWTPDAWKDGYEASLFCHPFACRFIERVRRFGVGGLLDPMMAAQIGDTSLLYQAADLALQHDYFEDLDVLQSPAPRATIDFSSRGAYSIYNWEIFFHIPMLVADRLMADRRFADAQRWLGYIFNPLRKPTELDSDKVHFWSFKPFREVSDNMSIEALLEVLHYEGNDLATLAKKKEMTAQIDRSRKNPFRPHDLARARPTAYMRSVVMKYLDNLIEWGDDLFRQDTRETTQEAAQLYILALQILGRRPRKLDDEDRPDKDWTDALDTIDDFSNFMVELENDIIGYGKEAALPLDLKAQSDYQANFPGTFKFAFVNSPQVKQPVSDDAKFRVNQPLPSLNVMPNGDADGPVKSRLYFCLPPNDKLLGYWDTIADRLFKLRNCLNIEGIRRDLALYDAPIDPALLARAAAQGIDIGTAVSNLHAPLPHYRFLPHLSIAQNFVAQVSSLGGALLQALEKYDAESLAVLRSTHEVDLLMLMRGVKEQAAREAQENLVALQNGRNVAVLRETYYTSREYMNAHERSEVGLSVAASADEKQAAQHHRNAAKLVALVPGVSVGFSGAWPTISFSSGGAAFAWPQQSRGDDKNTEAQQKSRSAARMATQAAYTRREEDWGLQASLATAEIKQIDAQITAAEIRLQMTELELANHDRQAEQSAEALAFMQTKFTNAELYSWLNGELRKLHHSAYQMALDLARRAERCYRYELAIESSAPSFVQFGHWDNRRLGLLAGERLAQDIRRMEAAYYENNRREYELTKRISLASFDPVALITLRKTGACHFNLPSVLFNLDHASHYLRRIKLVSVALPAVTGPYTNVGVTLTHESGWIRQTSSSPALTPVDGTAQAVAISVSQDDTGLFEPNMRDERYLPFEGRALEESKWRLELPDIVRQFDYETISDVVLTVRYTAREGGNTLATLVKETLLTDLQTMTREEEDLDLEGSVRVFSARAEFPEAWRAFIAAGATGSAILSLDLDEQRFPHPVPPLGTRTIEGMTIFARWAADNSVAPNPDAGLFTDSLLTSPVPDAPAIATFSFGNFKNGTPTTGAAYNPVWIGLPVINTSRSLGAWTLEVSGWEGGHAPEDIIIVVAHKVT